MKTIGKYQVVEEIGRSAAGVTCRVRDPFRSREVAVKILSPLAALSATSKEQLYRDLAISWELSHRHIAKVHDVGELEGGVYIATELLVGSSLATLAQTLPIAEKLALMAQVCEALASAHSKGIAHGNVKPGNIFVTDSGNAALLDFGTGTWQYLLLASGVRLNGLLPHYLAPEQILGQPFDGRSDVFSVGVILYEMLRGKHPFEAAPGLVAREIVHSEPEPLRKWYPQIPPELEEIVARSLKKDPGARVQTADELAANLYVIAQHMRRDPPAPPASLTALARQTAPESAAPVAPRQPVAEDQPAAKDQPVAEAQPVAKAEPVADALPFAETVAVAATAPVAETLPMVEALPVVHARRIGDAVPVAAAPEIPPEFAAPAAQTSRPEALPLPEVPSQEPILAPPAFSPMSVTAAPPVQPTLPRPDPPAPAPFVSLPPAMPTPAFRPPAAQPPAKPAWSGRRLVTFATGAVMALAMVGVIVVRQNQGAQPSRDAAAQAAPVGAHTEVPGVVQEKPKPSPIETAPAHESQPVAEEAPAQPAPEQILRGQVRQLWEAGQYAQAMHLVDEVLVDSPANAEARVWKKKIRAAQDAEAAMK